ncbi:MAG: proline--tRNA ligase [Desulfurococcales archaeon]|nr:proline--tRNA ligase [Desulfurococcales archaeon]
MNKVIRCKWQKEFSKWFDNILENGEFYDYGRYPVKGMGIWMPYGFQLRRRIIELIRKELDETGHEEILLPLLISDTLLRKEKEHIRGFEDEVYWVTQGGLEPLDVKLALRPTSETSITYMESLWIKSYKQLPKKYYQVVSIFRYETKSTKPMIRLREVTTFKEAHTVHVSKEDADRQVQEAISIYKRIFDELSIPYIISKRPEWDKFAGALYTIAFDTVFPDGRVLQIGTAHNLGQNFPKTFDFKIQLEDESLDYPWQTSYGLSDRVVASVIAMHGDDKGAILPVNVAPTQIVIVPIPSRSTEFGKILKYSGEIKALLSQKGLRVKIDDREQLRPGAKFYYWETRGVPVRLEIGENELNGSTVTLSRRDTGTKMAINLDELAGKIIEVMNSIMENLANRAWSFLKENVKRMTSLDEAKDYIASNRGIVEVPWCGDQKCAYELMEYIDAKALGTPYPENDIPVNEKCPVCGRKAKHWLRIAKTY